MADELRRPENEEHGSEPHLPSPTIWPFGFAAGIALALVGLIVSWPIVFVGTVIAVVFGFLWAREATREVRATPPPPEPAPREEERRCGPATIPGDRLDVVMCREVRDHLAVWRHATRGRVEDARNARISRPLRQRTRR